MREKLFNEIVLKDLQKLNELVLKGWHGTTDFDEAVSKLQFSLGIYLEEKDESRKEGEYLQESRLAKGA